MFAVTVVNIETPLQGTFHYHVPFDLRDTVEVGHLVEVEFGRQLAQAIIIGFDDDAPIEDTKPIIALIDHLPVVQPWQVELARWMSDQYLTPLNQCLRLMLPPGLTRWSDIVIDLSKDARIEGRITETQQAVLDVLAERGALRGRQLTRALPKAYKKNGKNAVRQLVKRDILHKGTVLEAPRVRPKKIAVAELILAPEKIRDEVVQLGRRTYAAEILNVLATCDDPLPTEDFVLMESGATMSHLQQLADDGLVNRIPAQTVEIRGLGDEVQQVEQRAAVGLRIRPSQVLGEILKLRGAEKYHAVLALLADEGRPVSLTDIYAKTGATRTHLNKLEKLELIRYGSEHVWRDSLADKDFTPAGAPRLTADQETVWQTIKTAMSPPSAPSAPSAVNSSLPFLLHGVTGSGKTEIYMRAIDLALGRGQQAIVLVPEIALTPQTVRRFAKRFPGRVAMMHSGLSDSERYDTWRRARLGRIDIIIGPRSAMFTPLANVGVVVVDEEHDESYKQTPPVPPPYYHARDAAIEIGRITDATVILGSATPSIVSYHRARRGDYELQTLARRVMGHRERIESQMARVGRTTRFQQATDGGNDSLMIDLPPVQTVDMRQELRAGNRSIFSRTLQDRLDETLARSEQAILFLNRRGTHTYVFCRDCGYRVVCPNCDLPLIHHQRDGLLICHHCNHREPPPRRCPQCDSTRIKYFGLGTQQLQEQVARRWPDARIVRWDSDTTGGKDSHDDILAQFVDGNADILVGTQMIAKGLDLPLVTLVGVISADVSLGLPDFRTGERTFQVLTQVAGRAGRGLLGGQVVLQTYQPDHYAIDAASDHDFLQFYVDEIAFRTQHRYPPFGRLARLVLSDPAQDRGRRRAEELAGQLRQHAVENGFLAAEIVGPTPPFFGRIDRRYRWQIVVKSADPNALLRDFHISRDWTLDIDPVSLL